MKRRSFLTAAIVAALAAKSLANNCKKGKVMQYPLTPLEYPHNALEPWIDEETVGFHHDKHQATYVANLNAALDSGFKFEGSLTSLLEGLEKVPDGIRGAVRNNGGGVWNHEFYWLGLSPNKSEPSPELLLAIEKSFGSLDGLKKLLSEASVKRFGSGWGWLCVDFDGNLKICSTPNQDNPIMGETAGLEKMVPLLNIDVWEHAYYLKYKNLRAEYVKNIWNLVNWKRVSERYEAAIKDKKATL